MAYVKRHAIKSTLNKAIKYIENKSKTDEGILITSNNCSSDERLAITQMNLLKNQYDKSDGILGFHFVQSFKPGETDKETAHQVGKEWADTFLSGYQYILSTHVDKGHIHNHIIINSVGMDGKKYHSCINEREDIRAYSDVICRKYGLSIINNKYQNRTMSYKEWLENKNKTSWKQKTKDDIDFYISLSVSFDDFIQKMKNEGYEIKHGDNVKHMTFRHPKAKRQVRGKTLGANYTEENIRNRIALKENDVGTVSTNKYKYKCKRDEWQAVFRIASYEHKTLKTDLLLIQILLNIIFKTNNNYRNSPRYYESQKILSNEIDSIVDQLNYIDQYNIKTKADLTQAKAKVNSDITIKQEAAKRYDSLYNKADAVCIEIGLYRKYKKYYDEYNSSLLKGAYKKKHEYELQKFESTIERLNRIGLKNENDYKSFEQKKEKIYSEKEELSKFIYEDYDKLEQLENIEKSLDKNRRNDIINRTTIYEKDIEEKENLDGRKI